MDISVRELCQTFSGKPPVPALDYINFEVPSGQFVAVMGPSGCGKSTLLRLTANLLQPTGGAILLEGCQAKQAAAARKIAWMAQSPALLPWLTVKQNVEMALRFASPKNALSITPDEALALVGLSQNSQNYPFVLSGGMQQRLALARTLVMGAGLWLMDEPFAALDELTRERLGDELLGLWKSFHPTVLWVTHHVHEALRMADRVLVFSARPAHLMLDLPVSLAGVRREDDPQYQRLLAQLRLTLKEALEAEGSV